MQKLGEAVEIAARVSALEQAHNIIRRSGEQTGSDIIRGILAGYAMAYRIIDPRDYAVLMRELCSFPPVRGGKLEVIIDNTTRTTVVDREGAMGGASTSTGRPVRGFSRACDAAGALVSRG